MATKSAIQWTDATWNIARGCTKVDEDCKFCYMYRESMDSTRYDPLQIVRTKGVFKLPLTIKEPSKIFTCSLTDFFHEAIDPYRNEAWDIIRKCPQHIFQILTKRPERIVGQLPEYWDEIRDRVWLGTSVGSQKGIQRVNDLVSPIQPGIKFLSLEPLHGEVILPFEEYVDMGHKVHNLIDWVIVGGESGNDTGKYRYRPCELEWIKKIVDDCTRYGIPVFVKQMGTYLSKQLKMSDRHGGDIDEFPAGLRIRQFPVTRSGWNPERSVANQAK